MGVLHEAQILYTVQPSDAMHSIATRFTFTVNLMLRANTIYQPITDPYLVYPGWLLAVPITNIRPLARGKITNGYHIEGFVRPDL